MSDIQSIERKKSRGYSVLVNEQNQIRVLHLAPGRWVHQLRGSLRVVSLKERPSYEALSYTWGQATDKSICINKKSDLEITDNLFWALKRLRRHGETRTVWVDAICIDQGDEKEKSRQVAIMGMIYEKATTVLVWLGEYSNSSSLDSWKMRRPHLGKKGNREIRNSRGQRFALALNEALRNGHPRWPDRAWVVQEFVLARETFLCFGPVSMAFDPVHVKDLVLHSPEPLYYLREFHEKVSDMVKLKHGIGDIRQSISAAILFTSTASCSDPRDNVYSLLALIDEKESRLMKVRYDQTCAQVYARGTFAAIAAQKSFAVLELVTLDRPVVYNLPTWTVDFTFGKDPTDGQLDDFLSRRPSLRPPKLFHTLDQVPALSGDTRSLTVRGAVIDRISNMLYFPSNQYNVRSVVRAAKLAERVSAFLRALLHENYLTSLNEETACAIAQFMEPSIFMVGRETIFTERVLFSALAVWDSVSGCAGDSSNDVQPFWTCGDDERMNRADDTVDGLPVLEYFTFVSGGVSLFLTSQGYIGLAPGVVNERDELVLLSLGKLPVILRRFNDVYTFRGFAWVPYLMRGELPEHMKGHNPTLEQFAIC